ncbi:hypothetical protein [Vreelandella aquamarina]|uniref:hypothetical protein n=1 Tax=Vreelandella aquamarina TaxID=77097 RepID=UPI0038506479
MLVQFDSHVPSQAPPGTATYFFERNVTLRPINFTSGRLLSIFKADGYIVIPRRTHHPW